MSQSLALYIDKYYIIAAVCIDGQSRTIQPENGEDRYWLYFYEDSTNNKVLYSRENKRSYCENKVGYYGDVFKLITNPEAKFKLFNREQEFYRIFNVSGILGELKSAIETDNSSSQIDTDISFSLDISDVARYVFLSEVLTPENGFNVQESVARIGHLALEYAFRRNQYSEDGHYLILNACNENLFCSIYKRTEEVFIRILDTQLTGCGMNLRGKALLEAVIDEINRTQGFIQTEEERRMEYQHLESFVPDWLSRLQRTLSGRATIIRNIRLSTVPNTYHVTIRPSDIDARTNAIVDDIVNTIANSITESGIKSNDLNGIIFLGDTFDNAEFRRHLLSRYSIDESMCISYGESQLSSIVAVYPMIDRSQFSEAAQKSLARGEDELKRLANAQEEKRRRDEAKQQQEKLQSEAKAEQEALKNYDNAMDNVVDYERKQEYAQMLDWATIALNLQPNSAEALQKKEQATRLLSEEKVRSEQYNAAIRKAQSKFKAEEWQDAISQAEIALNLLPDSKEAKRIIRDATKNIEIKKQIDVFFTKAEAYAAQDAYTSTLDELQKVLALDRNNKNALSEIKRIKQLISEKQKKVEKLVQTFKEAEKKGDYEVAMSTVEKLISQDPSNQREWTEKAQSLKAEKSRKEQEEQRWQELKKQIGEAQFEEKWAEVIRLATEALSLRDDTLLRANLELAKVKLKGQQLEEMYDKTIVQVKSNIVDKNWDKAKSLLGDLQESFPEQRNRLKGLFAQIFDAESKDIPSIKTTKRSEPVKKKIKVITDFFGNDSSSKEMKGSIRNQDEDDFFGEASKKKPRKFTSDDFDF